MEKSIIIMSHGWGFDINFFTPLSQEFNSNNFESVILDYGYFSNNYLPTLSDNSNYIAIAHSLGLANLLETYPNINWKKIIVISGFTKFIDTSQEETKLNNMIKSFKTNPQLVLKQFYKMCGINYSVDLDKINYNLLLRDLRKLVSLDISEKVNKLTNLISLYGEKDKIKSLEIIRSQFKEVTSIKEIGHDLGYNHTKGFLKIIKHFIEDN